MRTDAVAGDLPPPPLQRLAAWLRENGMAALLGLLFCGINSHLSYEYHLTEYHKLWLAFVAAGIICLALVVLAIRGTLVLPSDGLKLAGLLALPAILSTPGYLTTPEDVHFYATFEFARVLVLVTWALGLAAGIRSASSLRVFLFFVATSATYVAMVEILRAFGLFSATSLLSEATGFASVFGNPNFAGAFLAPLVPVLLGLPFVDAVTGRRWPTRGLLLIVAAVCTLGVVMTEARAALLAMSLAATLYGLIFVTTGTRSRWIPAAVIAIILGLGGTYVITSPRMVNDLASIADARVFDDRIPPWTAAVSMIEDAPLLGHGVGSFPELYGRHVTPVFRAYGVYGPPYFNHTHSEPLQVLVEGGFLGFLPYVALFFFVARSGLRSLREMRGYPSRVLIPAALLSILCGLFISLVSVTSRHVSANLTGLVGLSLVFLIPQALGDKPVSRLPVDRSRTWLTVGALSCILILSTTALVPWLASFGTLRSYRQALTTSDVDGLLLLEQRMRDARNPRLRHALLRRFYASDDLHAMAEELSKRSPVGMDYRDTPFYLAYVELRRGDQSQAERIATEYQRRDLYHQDTWRLLAALAVERQDLKAFTRQINLMTQRCFYTEHILPLSTPTEIRAIIVLDPSPVGLRQTDRGYELRISRALLYSQDLGGPEARAQLVEMLTDSEPVVHLPASDQERARVGIRMWVEELMKLLGASQQ